MKVPFLDLKKQHEVIQDEVAVVLNDVIKNTAFAGGPFVAQFETEFAEFCGSEYAVGVGSGTESLWLALLALGIGKDDEVITVPNTFIATAEAISFCGARPVFIDVDEKTFNMDPSLIEGAITPKTKAIIPVHLFGQMADMDPIMEIARKHGLYVVEDAAQSHGAEYKGKKAGSIGDAGCFSFYPGKNLGAYGEAGAVVTGDAEVDRKVKMLRDHGQRKKYDHALIGWNSRMDGFQGAVLSVKLKHLSWWNRRRAENAKMYGDLLSDVKGVTLPEVGVHNTHIYHIYAIRVKNRDFLLKALAEKEIYCGIHYPVPIHLQDAYGFLGLAKGSFPVAEKICGELISLPMFPELSEDQIRYTSSELKSLLAELAEA